MVPEEADFAEQQLAASAAYDSRTDKTRERVRATRARNKAFKLKGFHGRTKFSKAESVDDSGITCRVPNYRVMAQMAKEERLATGTECYGKLAKTAIAKSVRSRPRKLPWERRPKPVGAQLRGIVAKFKRTGDLPAMTEEELRALPRPKEMDQRAFDQLVEQLLLSKKNRQRCDNEGKLILCRCEPLIKGRTKVLLYTCPKCGVTCGKVSFTAKRRPKGYFKHPVGDAEYAELLTPTSETSSSSVGDDFVLVPNEGKAPGSNPSSSHTSPAPHKDDKEAPKKIRVLDGKHLSEDEVAELTVSELMAHPNTNQQSFEVLKYTEECRLAHSRSVSEIKADMVVGHISCRMVNPRIALLRRPIGFVILLLECLANHSRFCAQVPLFFVLSYIGYAMFLTMSLFWLSVIFLVAFLPFVAITLSTYVVITHVYAPVLRQGVRWVLRKYKGMPWLWVDGYVHYVPHLVSAVVSEFTSGCSQDQINTNIQIRMARYSTLPIPDVSALEYFEGSKMVIRFLLQRQSFFVNPLGAAPATPPETPPQPVRPADPQDPKDKDPAEETLLTDMDLNMFQDPSSTLDSSLRLPTPPLLGE